MEECPSAVLLLVEDEALIALDTQKRLEKHSYRVRLANNAASAIQAVEIDPCISMVLMDIELGAGMDGTEAARRILEVRDLPLIFMSSHSEPEIIERTETVSSYGYIVKGSAMPAILASLHMAQKLFAAQELAKEHTLKAIASEKQVRGMLDGLADGILAAAIDDFAFVYANITLCRWLDRSQEEFPTLSFTDIHPAEVIPRIMEDIQGKLAGDTGITQNIPLLTRDGSILMTDVQVTWLTLASKKCIMAKFSKVPEHRSTLQQLSVFREAVENASDAIGFSTADGRHYYQNKTFTEIFGKIGEHPDEELYVDTAIGREVFQKIKQGQSWNGKALLRDIDGKARPFHVRAYATRDEYGQLRTLVGMHTDIQDRERMERQIKEERDRAQLYLDMAGVFFLALDRDGNITMINRRGCAILGRPLHEVLGHSWFNLYLDPAESGKVQEIFRQIIAGELEQVEFHENEIRTADGSSRTIAWHNNVIRDDSGKIIGTISAGEDITQRRAAEAALRANEEKHRFLFENMTQGVVYHTSDGSILYANQSAANILGLSIDQLYGKTSLDPRWKAIHEDGSDYPGENHPIQVCLRTGQAVHDAIMGVYNLDRADYAWIRINAIPKLDRTGKIELVVVIFENLSEIKQYERSLQEQIDEKTVLVKETHHRIKNNIATISSLLSMQADGSAAEAADEKSSETNTALKEAVSRIESMQSLYETMLLRDDFKTVSAQDYLTELSGAVLKLFADSRHIQLKTQLQDLRLPPKIMFLMGIICNELLTNVMKYAFPSDSSGEVLLSLDGVEGYLELKVKDNGQGLPEDFDQKGRNGFGLMLVNMLSQQLKGSFEISTDKGTRAVLRFPK